MTKIYYFCEADSVLDADTQWYQVTVGTTRQAVRDKDFIETYSQLHQCYFEPRSEDSSNFICKVAESIIPQSSTESVLSLKMSKLSARCLVRLLKSQSSAASTNSFMRNRHRAMLALSLNYRVFSAMSRK